MQHHKTALDDALRSLKRKIIHSVAGSAAVVGAAGGILVVPEILSERSVTAALATLSEPTQKIESVIALAADYGQRAKASIAPFEPAAPSAPRRPPMLASVEPEGLASAPEQPAAPAPAPAPEAEPAAPPREAPRVLPEPRFSVFAPVSEMPRVTVEPSPAPAEPKPAEVAKPVAPDKPQQAAKPEQLARPVEPAQPPAVAAQPAPKPAEPALVSVPLPPERPRSLLALRPVETPKVSETLKVSETPKAPDVPKAQPAATPSIPPAAAAAMASAAPVVPVALISAEAFGAPTIGLEGESLEPLPTAKVPVAEEEIPTEVYKGPDALKPAVAAEPPKPADIAKPVERPKPKTPAEILGLNAKQRARAEKCLAEAVYFESRNEPVRGQIAVAQVVMNRVFSPYYPGEVCAVVYQNAHRYLSCQFTFACDGIPERVTERGPWLRAQRIAKQTLDGKVWRPEVAKATHYHADYVKPKWIRDMRTLAKHGRHIFYRPRVWGDGRNELGWVREHEMPMPRPRPVQVAVAGPASDR